MIIALYTTRVVLKVLGVENYGIYNVVGGFVSMFGVLKTSFTTGINRFYNFELGKKEGSDIKKVFNTSVVIQLLIALVLFVIVEGIGIWYINNVMVFPHERIKTVNWLFQFSVISMLLVILQTPYSSAILAYEKMDFFAVVSIVDALLKLAICFMIQHFGEDKLLTYGFLLLLITMINFMMNLIYAHIKFKKLRLDFHVDKTLFRSIFSYSGWTILNPLSYTARNQGCNMVLNYFFGPLLNAANGIANQVSAAVEQMSKNFIVSFRPQIIQSYASGEYIRTKRLMYSMSKITFLLHALFTVPVLLEINTLLDIWLGKDSIPEFAVPFACWILVNKWVSSLNPPITNVMAATGQVKKINIYTSCIMVSIIPITIVLLMLRLSPTSMFIAMLILAIINQYAGVRILCNTFTEVTTEDYVKKIIIPSLALALASIALPALICILLKPTLGRVFVTCGLTLVSVLISLSFYLDKEEKMLVKSMMTSLLKRFRIIKNGK